MLVLSAGKRNLHKFVSQCANIPKLRDTDFWKAVRGRSFYLEWRDGDDRCQASLHAVLGCPMLAITRYDWDGKEVSRLVHRPTLEQLREFGLVKDWTSKRGISKAFEAEARGPLS